MQDLLKYLPPSHPDHRTMGLAHALTMTQSFISKYNVAASSHPVRDRDPLTSPLLTASS